MMKNFSFLFLFFISSTTFSQMWCPPGSTWKYTFYGYLSNGYTELDYVGDTMISSITCKKIEQRFKGNYLFVSSTSTVDIHINNHFTYENSKVVYIYSYGVFDTLYNFNAKIGDKWRVVTHPGGSSCWTSVRKLAEVLDTTSEIINSVKLKKLTIKYVYTVPMSTNTITSIDTVYEKIGNKKNFLFPFWCETMIIDPDFSIYGQAFRCYDDNLFGSYKANGLTYCDFILGVNESAITEIDIKIFPNPSDSKIEIKTEPNVRFDRIEIANVLGELVFISDFRNELDVSQLKSGIYFLYLQAENGSRVIQRFVKE